MLRTILFLCLVSGLFAQSGTPDRKLWKGNAILGGGDICFVYSDDLRIVERNKVQGIQHLYYKDYTVDYVTGSGVHFYDTKGTQLSAVAADSVDIKDNCIAYTRRILSDGSIFEIFAYGLSNNSVIVKCKSLQSGPAHSFEIAVALRKSFTGDKTTSLEDISGTPHHVLAKWSNNVHAQLSCSGDAIFSTDTNKVVTCKGKFDKNGEAEVRIVFGDDINQIAAAEKTNKSADTYTTCVEQNAQWLAGGELPNVDAIAEGGQLLSFYKRCLVATKSACLNGQIPADMTGQFMTTNMPQLYPRDAMKCARIFLLTGHLKEAKDIISFWVNKPVPKKSKGEFYARYDANCKAVDGGSGARYDEPEWDANGYLIQLLSWYHEKTGVWLAGKEFIFELADFLCSKIDNEGLLYEGGIVEWTGYLPATNMICIAGLESAAHFAESAGNTTLKDKYGSAASKIKQNLPKMIDPTRGTFTDIRFHGGKAEDSRSLTEVTNNRLYLWDATPQFGPLWGFSDHKILEPTITFYEKTIFVLDGGVQYFESPDKGLAAYGNDAFFFTTASLAQYYSKFTEPGKALPLIRWMVRNSNCYGLMPERIYLNSNDCSDASPLSWCNAEFAASVLEYSKTVKSTILHQK